MEFQSEGTAYERQTILGIWINYTLFLLQDHEFWGMLGDQSEEWGRSQHLFIYSIDKIPLSITHVVVSTAESLETKR